MRRSVHLLRSAEALEPRKHARLERTVVGSPALERLRILARDHQHARASTEDRGQLRRMQESLDGAVEHQVGGAQRGHGGGVALQRDARAGRADRHRSRVRRGRHAHVDDAATEVLRRQPRRLDERGATRGLAEHGHDLAGGEPARDQRAAEDVERAVLHQAASTMSR
jgi:hypothetical protein